MDFDVVVVGGGCAGSVAAVAAARRGLRTILVEQASALGGTSTAVLDSFYGFYAPGQTRRLVGGIAHEVVEALDTKGVLIRRPDEHGGGVGLGYDPEVLKEIWDAMTVTAGVHLRLRSTVVGVRASTGSARHEVDVYCHGAVRTVRARVVIDASGDANAVSLAGGRFLPAEPSEEPQAMTTTFRLAGVDTDLARSFNRSKFLEFLAEARSAGMELPHDDVHIHRTTYPGGALGLMSRVGDLDPKVPEELTVAEIRGRAQAREYFEFLRRFVPGYAESYLVAFSAGIGIRESRRINGQVVLTGDDVRAGAFADQGVVLSGAPIEVQATRGSRWEFLKPGTIYGVPLGCQVPTELDNFLVAGRCISTTREAHASVRLMAQCMGLGESAAAAAAIALERGQRVADVDPADVLADLRAAGALPSPGEDSWV